MDRQQSGFTLIEMSIVLVIIGVIMGAVAIGTGLQRDAEYKRIKQTYLDPWVQAYNSYYQRTGVVIGDNQVEPRLMVNGERYTAAGGAPISGGNMTAVTAPNAVCRGAAGQNMARGFTAGTDPSIRDLMAQAGVRMPAGRAVGSEDRYAYLDSNGNPQELQVCFQWNNPGTASGAGNVLVLTGLTPDLARALDQMIDGVADAQEGVFRQEGIANGTANQAGVQWEGNNQQNITQTGAATGGSALNEDQVLVVTAHYKMNQ
ncbi:MAG TPA: prepilin-type cleavage/methylation domain-containing protein [Pseudohongiella sp.]|nr:prepilin-type cleavage/methylation domain-containing protein [Pseudohongiella sp.]HBX37175.1 prepilin-type cleavage/methylation domain-containing protein [Pseudohongiella sp.]|tara:strand:- start:289678 stop:290457 length:780 start_codon:yes stop_codon:yes gene_type:complete